MNILRRIEMFTSVYISYFILLGALLGILFPNVGKDLSPLILPSLFVLMFFASIKINVNKLNLVLKKKKLIFIIILIMYSVIPFVFLMLSNIMGLKNEYMVGVIFASLAPTIISAPYFIQKIGGDIELSYVLAIVSTVVFPVIVPLILYIYFGHNINIEYSSIVYTMLVLIVLPVLVALGLKRNKIFINKLKDYESLTTSASFLIFMWAIIALNNNFISSLTISFIYLFIIAFTQEILLYFIVKILCVKVFSIEVTLAKTIALVLAIKNTALTAGIAEGISPEFALPSAMVVLMHIPMFFLIGYYKDRF